MRKVWFFGDSSTFGHGLRPGHEYYDEYPSNRKPLWNTHICNYFKGEEINYAVCGASNEDIKFRVSTNLSKINDNDVVFIQYTHSGRINVFDKNSDFKPYHVHIQNSDINFNTNGFSKEMVKSFKNFMREFYVNNIENYQIRDVITLLAFKRELERRGVVVIVWSHSLISAWFRTRMGWKSIADETDNAIEDYYHMGFDAQKEFANFLINQYESGNTNIEIDDSMIPIDNTVTFKNRIYEDKLNNLYENVKGINSHKHFNESDIFI